MALVAGSCFGSDRRKFVVNGSVTFSGRNDVQRLDGQVAVVTGGGQGIGGATARRLAEEGAKVLIVDYVENAIAVNTATIRDAGGTVEALHADIGHLETPRLMVDEALRRYGKVSILVNNAFANVPGSRGSALDV